MDEGRPLDARQLEIAHSLFAAYGGEIGASLLLASIPNAYAAAAGAAVLAETGELSSNARRRIGETAQLVVDVLFPEGDRIHELQASGAFAELPALPIDGRGYGRVRTTRLTHAVIRQVLLAKGWKPEPATQRSRTRTTASADETGSEDAHSPPSREARPADQPGGPARHARGPSR